MVNHPRLVPLILVQTHSKLMLSSQALIVSMTTLNAEYNGPFSYVMDTANKELTITNSKVERFLFDGHTTTSEDLEMQLDVMSGVLQICR